MREHLQQVIADIVMDLYQVSVVPVLARPDEQFGDYATNVALQLARQLKKSPKEIAEAIAPVLHERLMDEAQDVSILNGFINIRLNDAALLTNAEQASNYQPAIHQGKQVVVEYSDPNPFKVLHVGHLYTSIVGDSMANLLERAGAKVHRVNFGGDVGRHVAITIWAIVFYNTGGQLDRLDQAWEVMQAVGEKSLGERADWLADHYVKGTNDFENDENGVKAAVTGLNTAIYKLHQEHDHESLLAKIYWAGREWSYEYFKAFYREVEVHEFEKFYPESETAEVGQKVVQEQLENGVFERSDGAIIFNGDKHGLHTRVFINSAGLPTYEAKDVGLIMCKWQDFHYDQSIIITGNDQLEYMKVVLKSVEQFQPELTQHTVHFTHGIVKLRGGQKMSSRKGNILRAKDVLQMTARANHALIGEANPATTLGAIKYAFLKVRLGPDIIYDPDESVSLLGNSGPYLQYAHARARSILAKAPKSGDEMALDQFEPAERILVRKLTEYPEVIDRAISEMMSHYICSYLYELCQVFNQFYEQNRVINDPRQNLRLYLVGLYASVLQDGLGLLGITAPDHL